MTDTKPTKADLIATLVAAGKGSPSALRRRTLADLTTLVAGLEPVEDPTPAPADEATKDGSEAVEEPTREPDAVYEARGNYNTVYAPMAEDLAAVTDGVEVWVERQTAMLWTVMVAGPDAAEFVALLAEVQVSATAALRVWQKDNREARRGQKDMPLYNQNRAFLAGYGQGVAAARSGKKRVRATTPRFAADMDRAMATPLAPEALAAGFAAGRTAKEEG